MATLNTTTKLKVIDAHLHIWADLQQANSGFPYSKAPPDNLRDVATTDALLAQMKEADVDGALLVQPINHKFDHSYIIQAMKDHPAKFRGMLLHDPSIKDPRSAVSRLEELVRAGFSGVRYNPYLWEKIENDSDTATSISGQQWSTMCCAAGMAVYKRCGDLGLPVGIMCFHGLSLHYDDIVKFATESPETTLILDHFGFTGVDDDDDVAFEQLLQLAQYKPVHVKISALFRLKDYSPYKQLYVKRFLPLLETFGADRLMYGSDFPFVLEQPETYKMNALVASWCPDETTRAAIMGGTAERVFGAWGVGSDNSAASIRKQII